VRGAARAKPGSWIGICPVLLGCLTFGAVVQACTRVSDVDRFPVRDEVLRIEQTVPDQGGVEVEPELRIDFCMSAFVDPRTISPVDAVLTSGEVPVDVELTVELLPWTGPGGVPLGSDVTAPWCEGSVLAIAPEIELEPDLAYRVRLVPRVNGWDGEELDTEQEGWVPEGNSVRYYLEFRVRPDTETETDSETETETGSGSGAESGAGSDSGAEPAPSPVALAELFDQGGPFDPARGLCSCHRDPDDLAFELLDLTDPFTAYADLVLDTRERDTGFPMVSPRLPSESFLVQKILRQHGERLRGVLGDAMPPDEPLPYRDYVAIAQWIEAGALP
jgi:hypothetical protein